MQLLTTASTSNRAGLGWLVVCVVLLLAASARGQSRSEASTDQEAHSLFEAGVIAFEGSRYEDALRYFRRSYELSGRHALLYNIAVAADRLRRDEEALEAFRDFVRESPNAPERDDAEVRITVLERTIRQRGSESRPDDDVQAPDDDAQVPDDDAQVPDDDAQAPATGGPSTVVLAGSVALGVAGATGLVAAIVGIAGTGCTRETAPGVCGEEKATNWAAVGVYGGLGLAAIVGAVLWLVLSGNDGPDEEAVAWRVGPNGLEIGW